MQLYLKRICLPPMARSNFLNIEFLLFVSLEFLFHEYNQDYVDPKFSTLTQWKKKRDYSQQQTWFSTSTPHTLYIYTHVNMHTNRRIHIYTSIHAYACSRTYRELHGKERQKEIENQGYEELLWSSVFWTPQSHCAYKPTAAVGACTANPAENRIKGRIWKEEN